MNEKFKIKNKGLTRTAKQGGFTLIETLVAVLILTISLSAILTLITSSIFYARYAKNETIATYLAQEAIDHIRNDRDTMAFQGGDWLGFLDDYGYTQQARCFSLEGCYLDANQWGMSNKPKKCDANTGCDYFYYDESATGGTYYNYNKNKGVPSFFRRTIKMNTDSPANGIDELIVEVKIEWLNGGSPRSQTLTTSLLKWQQ